MHADGYRRRSYAAHEIDLVAVYCHDLDRCYLLPVELAAERRAIWLRLTAARNEQRACINLASNFEFSGAVAQLEERSAGSRQVRGSSPLSSTRRGTDPLELKANDFRNRFGQYMEGVAGGQTTLITRHGRPLARLVPP